MAASDTGSVVIAGGASASTQFHSVLSAAIDAHPSVFDNLEFPSSAEGFRSQHAALLPRFEAMRADSEVHGAIARTLIEEAESAVVWRAGSVEVRLRDWLAQPASPIELETAPGDGGCLRPRVPVAGAWLEGEDLLAYARDLQARGSASTGVVEGVSWVLEHANGEGVDLRDRRIAILGAGAELAPTQLLLEGGAEVLWIDLAPPPVSMLQSRPVAGTVHWASADADLLSEPHRIRATIEAFATDGPVDVGLYAYAPGQAREWRLTSAMNAIVDALPVDAVRTVSMLVSPTTCGVLTSEDLAGERARREDRPAWQAVLASLGLLGRASGHVRFRDTCVNRAIVPIQGGSYQAAQYLGKLMAAETWQTRQVASCVSANTAGISRTASLDHPVFDIAMGGARAFGVDTFEPSTTAWLNGLLTIRDWLDPDAPPARTSSEPGPGVDASPLAATRVHGGIYQLPYPLESALRVATALGIARDPRQVGTLLRRR